MNGPDRKSLEETAWSGEPSPAPLPSNIRSIQPGGGSIQTLELAWGRCRRWYLKTFRPEYVRTMRSRLKGDPATCPVEVVDSRDLKFFRNVAGCWFDPADDVFAWRSQLPFARPGFAELLLFGGIPAALAVWLLWNDHHWWALAPALLAAFVVYFFRSPHRLIPAEPGAVVSPADGKIVDVTELASDEFIPGPVVRIGIFLSVFNVHVNRSSMAGRVIRLDYRPGKFLNALKPESATENERMEIWLVEPQPPHRRFVIRQIAGLIARRIVCEARPGQVLARGELFGMIKFGSRTELILPKEGLQLLATVGQTVQGGSTLLGRYG